MLHYGARERQQGRTEQFRRSDTSADHLQTGNVEGHSRFAGPGFEPIELDSHTEVFSQGTCRMVDLHRSPWGGQLHDDIQDMVNQEYGIEGRYAP